MAKPFREHHLLQLLEGYEKQNAPLDVWISRYFKEHKALGSKDRGEITETLYGMIRWQGLLDSLIDKPYTWEKRYSFYKTFKPENTLNDERIPEHIRVSFPKHLFDTLVADYGLEKAKALCLICNEAAPTTIRINPLKTTREALISLWKDKYAISPTLHSLLGIQFHKKIAFFSLPEFKQGLFEVQDEGSQLLANLIQPKHSSQVMDYCAGSGGKTLAFAPKLEGQGQIYLHDIRPWILIEAKRRLKRAGIQNAQIVNPEDPKLEKLKGKMDWVLVDVPCTGTGTLRRNPDMKWKWTPDTLPRLLEQQKDIFAKALAFLKPKGTIVYATCSLLKAENQAQVDEFCRIHHLERACEDFQTLPSKGGMDGFFGATLVRARGGE